MGVSPLSITVMYKEFILQQIDSAGDIQLINVQ